MVSHQRYIPDRGDIVWLDFHPTRGHEQSGRRPALILSPKSYNRLVGLVIVCPITSKQKGYNFEVSVMLDAIASVILSDQVRSLDWKARHIGFITKVNPNILAEVLENIRTLLNV